MKYVNANEVLPKELISKLQEYVQGYYIYVPKIEGTVRDAQRRTEYKIELEKRNQHIYVKFLQKWSKKEIARRYHLSEASIRRIIFTQKNKAKEVEKMIQNVLSFWDIKEETLEQCHEHVWEIGTKYIIKVYDDEESLQRNLKILKELLKYDVPVSTILETKEEKDFVEFCGKYYVITEKLSGEHIKDARKDGVAYRMGCAIGQLHKALEKCEDELEFWENSLLEELEGWIKEKFESDEWKLLDRTKYQETVDKLQGVYNELPKQLIHRDVHSGNFLFENDIFSGYIDFDLSQKNIRIFDLAYFLAGLLTEENGIILNENEWLEIIKNVIKGYESKIKLLQKELEALSLVMESIELLFAAYFISVEDTRCAMDAIKVYDIIKGLEKKIYMAVK